VSLPCGTKLFSVWCTKRARDYLAGALASWAGGQAQTVQNSPIRHHADGDGRETAHLDQPGQTAQGPSAPSRRVTTSATNFQSRSKSFSSKPAVSAGAPPRCCEILDAIFRVSGVRYHHPRAATTPHHHRSGSDGRQTAYPRNARDGRHDRGSPRCTPTVENLLTDFPYLEAEDIRETRIRCQSRSGRRSSLGQLIDAIVDRYEPDPSLGQGAFDRRPQRDPLVGVGTNKNFRLGNLRIRAHPRLRADRERSRFFADSCSHFSGKAECHSATR